MEGVKDAMRGEAGGDDPQAGLEAEKSAAEWKEIGSPYYKCYYELSTDKAGGVIARKPTNKEFKSVILFLEAYPEAQKIALNNSSQNRHTHVRKPKE